MYACTEDEGCARYLLCVEVEENLKSWWLSVPLYVGSGDSAQLVSLVAGPLTGSSETSHRRYTFHFTNTINVHCRAPTLK